MTNDRDAVIKQLVEVQRMLAKTSTSRIGSDEWTIPAAARLSVNRALTAAVETLARQGDAQEESAQ